MLTSIDTIYDIQHAYFLTGKTYSIPFRKRMLLRLRHAILNHESHIAKALATDLGKPETETITTEIGIILEEIQYHLKHLDRWAKKRTVPTNLYNLPAHSYTLKEPYGNTLIISPWNYPFQLAIAPLIGAISGGNTAIIKPSEYAPATSSILKTILRKTFPPKYVAIIEGGIEETQALLDYPYDLIFFTGSPKVGRIIMEKASKHLTPVILELGGKSPCIIDETTDLPVAVRKILYGKAMNAGQTCIAPDYMIMPPSMVHDFVQEFEKAVSDFYGSHPLSNMDYCTIINDDHYNRLKGYLSNGSLLYGGGYDDQTHRIEPTLIQIVDADVPLMNDEIFGPILPIMTFTTTKDIMDIVAQHPNPLAFYLFSENQKRIDTLLTYVPFGGGCINETLMHITNPRLPFGGRGNSGMGRYHGHSSFDAFTHTKSVMHQTIHFDFPLRYPPYDAKKLPFIKGLLYKS